MIAAVFFGHHIPGVVGTFFQNNIHFLKPVLLGAAGVSTGLSTATAIYYYKKNFIINYKITIFNKTKKLVDKANKNKENLEILQKINSSFSSLINKINKDKGKKIPSWEVSSIIQILNEAKQKIETKIKELQKSQTVQ